MILSHVCVIMMQTLKGLRQIGNNSKAVERLFNKTLKNVPEIKDIILEHSQRTYLKNKRYYQKNKKRILQNHNKQKI